MIYNAEGKMLAPYLIHKGDIPHAVQTYFAGTVFFAKTEDGNISKTLLVEVVKEIER